MVWRDGAQSRCDILGGEVGAKVWSDEHNTQGRGQKGEAWEEGSQQHVCLSQCYPHTIPGNTPNFPPPMRLSFVIAKAGKEDEAHNT